MTLGLFLILIVIVPYCIYLYIKNKELIIKIKELEKNNKEILTRKILKNNDQDTLPLTSLSSKQSQNNKKEISKDNRKKEKEETNINQTNNKQNIKENNRGEYLKEVVKKLNEQQTNKPVELTKYEQEQENNAIISYQELKKEDSNNKFIVKEEDEVVDFLNHLKEFRNNLK